MALALRATRARVATAIDLVPARVAKVEVAVKADRGPKVDRVVTVHVEMAIEAIGRGLGRARREAREVKGRVAREMADVMAVRARREGREVTGRVAMVIGPAWGRVRKVVRDEMAIAVHKASTRVADPVGPIKVNAVRSRTCRASPVPACVAVRDRRILPVPARTTCATVTPRCSS